MGTMDIWYAHLDEDQIMKAVRDVAAETEQTTKAAGRKAKARGKEAKTEDKQAKKAIRTAESAVAINAPAMAGVQPRYPGAAV